MPLSQRSRVLYTDTHLGSSHKSRKSSLSPRPSLSPFHYTADGNRLTEYELLKKRDGSRTRVFESMSELVVHVRWQLHPLVLSELHFVVRTWLSSVVMLFFSILDEVKVNKCWHGQCIIHQGSKFKLTCGISEVNDPGMDLDINPRWKKINKTSCVLVEKTVIAQCLRSCRILLESR